MEWNIAAESISLVMLGIIWVYSRRGSHLPTLKNKIFQGCLMVTFSAMFTNILSTVMIYQYQLVPMWLTWVVTTIYFILTPLMGLSYFLYTLSVIYSDNVQIKRVIEIGVIPGIVYTLMVLANPFTKNLFDINLSQGYTRGALVSATYIIFYAYCIASIITTIINHKRIDRRIFRILASFPVLAVMVIIVQQMYPDVILSGSAATCALLIIYLHLQNRQISQDYLTGIPNRQELLNMLGLMTKRDSRKKFVFIVVSLRDFRQINNSFGQQMGDKFLKEVSKFLETVGPGDNVYRFSGDEFAMLFTNADVELIKECVARIEERMKEPWQVGDYRLFLSVVMGVINHLEEDDTLEKMVNAIEYAVTQAKTGKYGHICYCDKEMREKLERKRKIVQILKDKLAGQSFEMYYQPIYSIESGSFMHAESLMRIPESPIGPIYPSEFIPIAEETGLIVNLTYAALDKVCKYINRLKEKQIPIGSIHVNFSGLQFSQSDLTEKVLEIIQKNHTPMSAVKIEFTESTLAESPQVVTEFALEMKSHGIMMGLDDFGTGYSNIATVIRIPFGTIKLDRSLVLVAMDNEKAGLTIKNLTLTFKQLGMKVVAEGVETEEQRQLITGFGVDQIQGFYYAKPMPEDEMEAFMLQKMLK